MLRIKLPTGKEKLLSILEKRSNSDIQAIVPTVQGVIDNISANGDEAILEYTEKFDNVIMSKKRIKVTNSEIEDAYKNASTDLIEALTLAAQNIEEFHELQVDKSWFTLKDDGIMLGQKITPIETVGVYVPGGTAPLISSVLMNVIPAKVAGVNRIVLCTPPDKNGNLNGGILTACKIVGVDEVYKVGGAQAIAAMAYGTETIPKVDKVCGPGNIYVSIAKKLVYGKCDIDMIAGPSEILIIADESAKPEFVAADLLSQAEHDILASSILITNSEDIANKVESEVDIQLEKLERKEIAKQSIDNYGILIVVDDLEIAVELSNEIAPEHLELCVEEAFDYSEKIQNAGAIFMGNYSPEPLGDYFAGPNHVLPTVGTAKFYSPLNVTDFIKRTSLIKYSETALLKVAGYIETIAETEGLTAHKHAISIRKSH